MEPVVLRHKDATRQAWLYLAFTVVVSLVIVVAFTMPMPGKWYTLIFVPVILFLAYSTLRLATLKVRLDSEGIWEPNPFRLTYVTPWSDVARVRKTSELGAMKTRFITIEVVHRDGESHEILALKMQGGAAYAEPQVEGWIDDIREYKKVAT